MIEELTISPVFNAAKVTIAFNTDAGSIEGDGFIPLAPRLWPITDDILTEIDTFSILAGEAIAAFDILARVYALTVDAIFTFVAASVATSSDASVVDAYKAEFATVFAGLDLSVVTLAIRCDYTVAALRD